MGRPAICRQRLEARLNEHDAWKKRRRLLGSVRLYGAIAGVALIWAVETYLPDLTWPVVALLVAAFIVTMRLFATYDRKVTYAGQAAILYVPPEPGRNRRDLPEQSVSSLDRVPEHPFARDLDIAEEGGLADFIHIGATRAGMARLAKMLTMPVENAVIAARQAAVAELAPQLDLRERFFVAGSTKRPFIRTHVLDAWTTFDPASVPKWVPKACFAASIAAVASLGLALFGSSLWFYALAALVLAAEAGLYAYCKGFMGIMVLHGDDIHVDVRELCGLVEILEEQDFKAPALRSFTDCLRWDGGSATAELRRFSRLISWFEAARNQIVAILGPLVMYQTQLALAMERWRSEHRAALRDWIAAVGQFEAYSSLSCFAFEHPGHAYPSLAEDGPVLRAENIAHPLLPADAVGNDVSMDGSSPILVVSGANMAGKSTLLRAIGANVALAYAGAPVRATSMTLSRLRIIASIKVNDSLREGLSRFAVELRRLSVMLEMVRAGKSSLILIDELFAGTNSFDRYIGAVALAEFILASDSSLAVLSTHDRNVTQWAEGRAERIANVHFEDIFRGKEMKFDYKLKSGPATRGNAVELMKRAGLDIPADIPPPRG